MHSTENKFCNWKDKKSFCIWHKLIIIIEINNGIFMSILISTKNCIIFSWTKLTLTN